MSQTLSDFELIRPATLAGAIAALQEADDPRLYAGGTDLIANMRHGLNPAKTLIDITAIDELSGIMHEGDGLSIGAATPLCELEEDSAITRSYPAIAEAVRSVAGPAHRQAATLGGNLCLDTRCLYYNQSGWWRQANGFCLKYNGDVCRVAPSGKRCRAAFSGDLAPALMVHDAEIAIAGPKGRRQLPLREFYREDGADHLLLAKGEIVTGVHLPPPVGVSAYRKLRLRGAIDFPLAGVAISCVRRDSGWHFAIALTGTNSCPLMVDMPPLGTGEDVDAYFSALGRQVQKTASPQRTTAIAPHYRRLSIAAMAIRLARDLWRMEAGR